MLRVESRRWLNLVFIVLILASGGATLLGRVLLSHVGFVDALLVGAGWGALAGVACGLPLMYYFARRDTLRLAVQNSQPRALVLLGVRDTTFVESLKRAVQIGPQTKNLFTLSFDGDGLSLWRGVHEPERMLLIPAKSIVAVTSTALPLPLRTGNARDRIAVSIQAEGGVTDLSFGVEAISAWGTTRMAAEAEIAELVVRANAALGATPVPSEAPRPNVVPLAPGITAWAAARLSSRGAVVLGAVFLVLFGVWVYRFMSMGASSTGVLVPAIVLPILNLVAQLLSFRALKRERAAGYTTLNRAELSLPQLHPRTGALIRAAGAPPLSKQQFDRLLR